MHDEYQELSAAASIGQATPEEIARLGAHLLKCGACRRAHSEFTNMAAQFYAVEADTKGIPPEEHQVPNADLLRRRFLQRAEEKGILSAGLNRPERQGYSFPATRLPILERLALRPALTMAAVLGVVLSSVVCAYMVGRRSAPRLQGLSTHGVQGLPKLPSAGASVVDTTNIVTLNAQLQAQVSHLKAELATNREQLRGFRERLVATSENSNTLTAAIAKREAALDELQTKLSETEAVLKSKDVEKTKLEGEAAKLRGAAGAADAAYAGLQSRLRELSQELAEKSAALNRDDELLQRDRDIRAVMVARNLHIFDVFDTNARGETSRAFGRIFYTEGKSLLFYAYDLDEAKVRNANYHYRVWGGSEAEKDLVRSLGIFYSDDRSQRRWVFKCDDPKILSQIDSVFVTLEPPGATSSRPKGQKLLDAYLRGIPNHP